MNPATLLLCLLLTACQPLVLRFRLVYREGQTTPHHPAPRIHRIERVLP